MLRDALDAFKCGPILHDHPRFFETERFDEVCEPWAKRGKFIDITLQLEAILKIEKREHLLKNFLNEGVDDAVLGYLTDADLKELGVAKIGDRRRLLAAFAQLNHEGGAIQSSPMPKAAWATSSSLAVAGRKSRFSATIENHAPHPLCRADSVGFSAGPRRFGNQFLFRDLPPIARTNRRGFGR